MGGLPPRSMVAGVGCRPSGLSPVVEDPVAPEVLAAPHVVTLDIGVGLLGVDVVERLRLGCETGLLESALRVLEKVAAEVRVLGDLLKDLAVQFLLALVVIVLKISRNHLFLVSHSWCSLPLGANVLNPSNRRTGLTAVKAPTHWVSIGLQGFFSDKSGSRQLICRLPYRQRA